MFGQPVLDSMPWGPFSLCTGTSTLLMGTLVFPLLVWQEMGFPWFPIPKKKQDGFQPLVTHTYIFKGALPKGKNMTVG